MFSNSCTGRQIVCITLAFCSIAGAQERGPITLPSPTGPFPVGHIGFQWVDDKRPEPMGKDRSSKRQILVHVWYPAETDTRKQPTPYLQNYRTLISALGEQSLEKEFGAAHASLMAGKLLSHSVLNSKPARTAGKLPVLLFSHGVNTLALEYTAQLEDLASHGYLVAAIDHVYDSLATVFPDGRVVRFAAEAWKQGGREHENERLTVWAEDLRFALNQLAKCNSDQRCSLHGRMDLDRVGAFGHSVGARATARACQQDARIKACINEGALDRGFPFAADANGHSMDQPFLMISRPVIFPDNPSEEELTKLKMSRAQFHETVASIRKFWLSIRGGSSWVQIRSETFQHNSFTDSSFLAPRQESKARSALHDLVVIRAYVRGFFDQHVRGLTGRDLAASSMEIKSERYSFQ